jgi:uncharacterized protein YqjF (DUF2071 family)
VSLPAFLTAPSRQASVLEETRHRPWPLPDAPWVMAQTWDDLAFLHWRVPAAELRPRVPAQLELDEFDGSAWIGVTPFRLSNLRGRGLLPVPKLSSFLELNVRTYATYEDKPGIWFFSLDAESPVAVRAARALYRLPYFDARMGAWPRGEDVEYESVRTDARAHRAEFRGRYGPRGPAAPPAPGSLEHFLTERYCLYATNADGELHRADIHHPPWPLQPGEAEVTRNTMPPPGVDLPDEPPLVHFSKRQDVLVWPLTRIAP